MKPVIISHTIVLISILFVLYSCRKDDYTDASKEADICPEIAMGNYEEAGIIINDYLNTLSGTSTTVNLEQLDKYLGQCNCVDNVSSSAAIIKTYPAIKEYNISFVVNSDTINSIIDIAVYGDGSIEYRRFHD